MIFQDLRHFIFGLIAVVCLSVSIPLHAQIREKDAAQHLADSFWPMKRGGENVKPEIVYTEQDSVSKHPYFYIFNRGKEQGYVIISADERSKQIIGYSDTGTFDPDNVPSQLRAWLRVCKDELQQLAVTPDSLLKMDFGQFVLSKGRTKGSQSFASSVSPLLGQINYSQNYPYNALCPNVSGKQCVTGCVATAATQIMRYWEYPKQPTGKKHTYIYNGLMVSATYDTPYDWKNMLPTYTSHGGSQQQVQAIARLMADAGAACNMEYTPTESGALTSNMALGMIDYFGYDKGVVTFRRADFTQADFVYYLKRELNAGRPVLFSGVGSGGGHCFVCDGYDAAGLFHINWGWNGMSNGYFQLAHLSPVALGTGGGSGGFNDEVVFYGGIQPPRAHSKPVYLLSFEGLSGVMKLRKGKPFDYTIKEVANPSLYSYEGQIGIGLYRDGQLIDVLGSTSQTFDPKFIYPSITITGTVPKHVEDGDYQLVMVCKAEGDDVWRSCLNNNCNCVNITVSGKDIEGAFDYATHYLDLPDNGFDQVASNSSASTEAEQSSGAASESGNGTGDSDSTPAGLTITKPLSLSAGNELANGNQTVSARLLSGTDFEGKVGVFIYDSSLENCVSTLQAGTITLPARQESDCDFSGVLNLPDGNYFACLFYINEQGQWGQVPQYKFSCTPFAVSDQGRLPAAVSASVNVMPGEEGGVVGENDNGSSDAMPVAQTKMTSTFTGLESLDDNFYDDVETDSEEGQNFSFDEFGEEVFSKAVNDQEPFICQRLRFKQKDMTDAGGRMVYSFRKGESGLLSFELLNKHDTAQKRILTLSLYDKDDHWVTDLAEQQVEVKAKDRLSDSFTIRFVDVVPGPYKLRLTQAANTRAVSKPVAPSATSSMYIQIIR